MRSLEIDATGVSPRVTLDKENNIFEIFGKSIMPDTEQFYQPLMDWFDDYALRPNREMTLIFHLKYYNLTSVKYFMFIVYKLREVQRKGNTVSVIWHYSIYDDYMKEFGEDLAGLYDVPFTFTPYDVFDKMAS